MGSYVKLPPDPSGSGGAVASVTASTGLVDSGTATDPVLSVAASIVSGAASGATAVQPNTSPTLSGLTVTGLSGVVKAAAGLLSAALILTADITDANVTLAKLSGGVQTSLGKADSAIQAANVVSNLAAGVLPALTNPSGLLKVNDAGTAVVYSAVVQSSAASGGNALTLTQAVSTSGSPSALSIVGAAHTTLAASTEASDVNLNLARTVQFATGAIATQRAVRITAPTYAFVGASTITTAATVSISGAPVAGGANATMTNAMALWLETGALGFGATPALAGDMRVSHGWVLNGRDNAGANNRSIIDWGGSGFNDRVTVSNDNVQLDFRANSTGFRWLNANTVRLSLDGSVMTLNSGTFAFGSTLGAALIQQVVTATATVTAAPTTIAAQDASGTTAVTAGKLTQRGGDATGGSGTRNGGGYDMRAGTGATSNGTLRILDGATVRLSVNGTGLGLYATTPVAQAARVGQITDNTTGTADGTCVDVGVAFSQSAVNNNFADVIAKINALETAVHNIGLTA